MSLIKDKSFKKYAKAYAEDEELFFKECVALLRLRVLFHC